MVENETKTYINMVKRELSLYKLPKTIGGRNKHVETLSSVCQDKKNIQPTGWLKAKRTLKTPESIDIFGHVVQAIMNDEKVVVKVYEESSNMLKFDIKVLKHLTQHKANNIIRYICDFSCDDVKIRWNKQIKQQTPLCIGGNDKLHFIVMEYIEHGNLYDFFSNNVPTNDELTSILKQIAFCIIDLYTNFGIAHDDIHGGNILIDKDEPKNITYVLNKRRIIMNTHGIEPIFIDFGRIHNAYKKTKQNTNNVDIPGMIRLEDINWPIEYTVMVYQIIRNNVRNNEQKDMIKRIEKELLSHKINELDKTIDYLTTI